MFNWMPENSTMDEMIIFDASDSYDSDGTIILYEWDWDNDGNYDELYTGPNATHSWSNLDNYAVSLRVTDDENVTDTVTRIINIINIIVILD